MELANRKSTRQVISFAIKNGKSGSSTELCISLAPAVGRERRTSALRLDQSATKATVSDLVVGLDDQASVVVQFEIHRAGASDRAVE